MKRKIRGSKDSAKTYPGFTNWDLILTKPISMKSLRKIKEKNQKSKSPLEHELNKSLSLDSHPAVC
jgi:hypothetical protein